MGAGDYSHFVWVQLSELQKSITEVGANLQNVKSSVDGLKSKVDDLVAWKNRIIGGAIMFGALCAVLGFVISKAGDYVTIKAPVQPTQAATATK
jgi:hypothetical protein